MDEPGAETAFKAELAPSLGRSLGRGCPQEPFGSHIQIQVGNTFGLPHLFRVDR